MMLSAIAKLFIIRRRNKSVGEKTHMRVVIVRDLNELLSYRREWEQLSSRCSRGVFGSPGWVIPWIEVLSPKKRLLCMLFFCENDELVGFVPTMVIRKCCLKVLTFIGNPLNDLNEILVEPQHQRTVFRLLFDILNTHGEDWDIFDCELISAQQMKDLMLCDTRCAKHLFRQLHPVESPIIELPDTKQKYYGGMTSNWRHRLKGRLNKISKDAAFEFTVLFDYAEIRQYIESFEYFRLDCWRKRHTEDLPAISQGKDFKAFLFRIAEELAHTRSIAFPCLKHHGTVVAMGLYFLSPERIMNYMKSWNIAFYTFSPGKVIELRMIEYAIEHGVKTFDFGRGNEPYKYEFMAKSAYLEHCIFCKRSISGALILGLYAFCEYCQCILLGRMQRIGLRIRNKLAGLPVCVPDK